MMKGQGACVMDYFRELDDPRIERSKRHQLLDIVAIAICAVICGAALGCVNGAGENYQPPLAQGVQQRIREFHAADFH